MKMASTQNTFISTNTYNQNRQLKDNVKSVPEILSGNQVSDIIIEPLYAEKSSQEAYRFQLY